MGTTIHRPVMLKEMIGLLNPKPGTTIVDATLGAGGYAAAILESMDGNGLVVGIDHDDTALKLASERLAGWGKQFQPLKGNFGDLATILAGLGIGQIDGIVADLGVSSMQLSDSERGFSFQLQGPLDMRMDLEADVAAADLVNTTPLKTLEEILRDYGEERYWRRISREIVARRRRKRFETTLELAQFIEQIVHGRRGRIHPATRVFQALRIAVNGELDALQYLCDAAPGVLRSEGVIVCVSYHSLEDRIVKQSLRRNREMPVWEPLTKKPMTPTEDEKIDNPRSRSARLRAARRR